VRPSSPTNPPPPAQPLIDATAAGAEVAVSFLRGPGSRASPSWHGRQALGFRILWPGLPRGPQGAGQSRCQASAGAGHPAGVMGLTIDLGSECRVATPKFKADQGPPPPSAPGSPGVVGPGAAGNRRKPAPGGRSPGRVKVQQLDGGKATTFSGLSVPTALQSCPPGGRHVSQTLEQGANAGAQIGQAPAGLRPACWRKPR